MRPLADDLDRWRAAGLPVVIARVVDIDGSGPRLPGAAMAVNGEGEVAGSVSGGCVEGAVVAEALAMLDEGGPGRVVSFGYSDDDAFSVGLTCGGTVHLFLEPFDFAPLFDRIRGDVDAHRPVVLATVIGGPDAGSKLLAAPDGTVNGSLGHRDLDRVVTRDALAELAAGRTGVRHYGPHGEAREDAVPVFVESFAPPPRMLIFGAVDFTASLARAAKLLGFHVTVCDAREVFATPRRFPMADEVVVDWPDRLLARVGPTLGDRDAVCILTHDHKFDVPAIIGALATEVGYLGAMGSRRTHAGRLELLREAGLGDEDLTRLHAPIGLDLGAATPEETAVSICAEIIAHRTGRSGAPLATGTAPIHP